MLIRKIKSGWRLFWTYLKFNMASIMEYRASFLSSAVGMFFSNATFIFFWFVLFSHTGGDIGGYDFKDVMFIWSAGTSSFGFVYIIFGNITQLNNLVITGELDTFLLQPRNVLINLLLSKTEFTAWGDFLYGFVLIALTNQGLNGFLGFLLATFCGGLVLISVMVILQSTVFFLGDSSFLSSMSLNLTVNFNTYPVGIYPNIVQKLLYIIIPSQFMVHVPLRIARGEDVLIWLPLQILATFIFPLLAMWFFKKGVKRYETGNLIVTRL